MTLKCRAIDRIFLQAYVPKRQSVGQVCTFLRWRRKCPIPSSAAFGKIGEHDVKAIHAFAANHRIPVVHLEKGQDKEAIARPSLEAAARPGRDRVVLIGIAQEQSFRERYWRQVELEWGLGPVRTISCVPRPWISNTFTSPSCSIFGQIRALSAFINSVWSS